jgi:lysozyme
VNHLSSFLDFINENVVEPTPKIIADFIEKSVSGLGTNEEELVGAISLIKNADMLVAVNQLMSKGGYAYKTVGAALDGELESDNGYYKNQIDAHLKSIEAADFINSVKPIGKPRTNVTPAKSEDIVKTIVPRVKKHEGVKPKVYTDSRGYKTVGVGMKLSRGDADTVLKSVGANPAAVKSGKQALSPDQMDKILIKDLMTSKSSMERVMPNFTSLPPDIQGVLIEMNFNLGTTGLLKFKKFLDYIKGGKYQEASEEMLRSAWAKQVGDRAKVLADVVAKA